MENLKKERRGYILSKKSICKVCGYELAYCKPFDPFYCNEFCCNPCCPDSHKIPCLKEKYEKYQSQVREFLEDKDWDLTNEIMKLIVNNQKEVKIFE